MPATKKSTHPFVWVIAAIVIAILSLGLRYVVSSLDSHEEAVMKETEVKNYLNPGSKKQATTEETPANSGESMTTETPANSGTASNTGN